MSEVIGFIGLGQMGHPMARNLIKAGYTVRLHNRTRARADDLIAAGAQWANDPSEVAEPGHVVVSMLASDPVLESMAGDRLLERLGPDGIHLSMSTVSPAIARRLAQRHRQHRVSYLAAPVFGRPQAAEAAKLWICLSGPTSAKERVRPILGALGQGLFDFGEEPGAANVVKLCGNFLIAAANEAMAEAFALAEKNGIERARVAELIGQTLFACPVYQGYGNAIAHHRYQPAGFKLPLGLKDVDLVLQTAAASRVPMPVASLLHDRLLGALAKGRDELDWSALALGASEDASLPVPK